MSRLFWLLLLSLLAACARPPQPVWTELPSAETLLQHLAVTTGQVRSLDAVATVSLNVKGKVFSSQQFLLVEKPDHLRADVLTGFGQLILQLTTDGEQLAVFMNAGVPGHFYRGPATAENLARFTHIPLATRDMVRLLLYDPPLIDFQHSEVTVTDGTLVLRLTNPERRQELLFNEKLQLIGYRYFSAGQTLLEVAYQRFTEETHFPRTIRINLAAEKTRAVIKFSELQINIEIQPDRFRLKKPAKIPVEAFP
ncbi:MAG: DUF4292 domain-containing protein [Deltaproteobacteria bacterium]|nr:DUF4292 domain-containing protein [Deltaproteobacteria bacterium]